MSTVDCSSLTAAAAGCKDDGSGGIVDACAAISSDGAACIAVDADTDGGTDCSFVSDVVFVPAVNKMDFSKGNCQEILDGRGTTPCFSSEPLAETQVGVSLRWLIKLQRSR